MPRKPVIAYTTEKGQPRISSTWYLATNDDCMRFYCFDEPVEGGSTPWTLIDQLDRSRLLGAGTKDTAKTWAKRLGLNSWSYVRV
jgi:hypothetical protein